MKYIRLLTNGTIICALVAGVVQVPVDVSASDSSTISVETVPARLFGIGVDPDNPLRLDFMIDLGADVALNAGDAEARRIIDHFLTSLAMPEDRMWVNLSPEEPDRIIPEDLGRTDLGQIMLDQDRVLKQLTASLLNPESPTGEKFWERVYGKMYDAGAVHALRVQLNNDYDVGARLAVPGKATHHALRTTDMIESFNKIWILPDSATVVVDNNRAFVVDARLKVMMESDYLAEATSNGKRETGTDDFTRYSLPVAGYQNDVKQVIKDVILPVVTDEVNHGSSFAPLRQIYQSMVLAAWFKRHVRGALLNDVYAGRGRLAGVDNSDPQAVADIYQDYLSAFQNGVFSVIREEYDPAASDTVVRNYFSGGIEIAGLPQAVLPSGNLGMLVPLFQRLRNPVVYRSDLKILRRPQKDNSAMLISPKPYFMASVFLTDIGIKWTVDDETYYENSFEEADDVLEFLASMGVGDIYFYGGLYEMSETSEKLHQVEDDGEHLVVSDDRKCFVRIKGYLTKRQKTRYERSGWLKDRFRNPFSIMGLDKINRLLTGLGKDPRDHFRKLVQNAKDKGITVTVDFIPWLAPEAIDENRLAWTKHRKIEITDLSKENILRILRENDGYYLRKIGDGYYLIRHFYEQGSNKDQTYLNAFRKDVQDYYIENLKARIDDGVTSFRVDLAHYLLRWELEKVFDAPLEDVPENEPWHRIMSEVQKHADQKGIDLIWVMEAYTKWDIERLKEIAASAGTRVRFYAEDAKTHKLYQSVAQKEMEVHKLVHHINEVIYGAVHEQKDELGFFSNFDEQSLENIGGPVKAMIKFSMILGFLDVPWMIDLRELGIGHIAPVSGGINAKTGEITHPFLTEEQLAVRKQLGGFQKLLQQMPWPKFAELLEEINQGGAELIMQEHPVYPWYFCDFEDIDQRKDFFVFPWKSGENLNLFVVGFRKPDDERKVRVKLPHEFAEKHQLDFLEITLAPGEQDRLITLNSDGQIVDHSDAAMMLPQAAADVGGVDLGARHLRFSGEDAEVITQDTPEDLTDIDPDDIIGIVPAGLERRAWQK